MESRSGAVHLRSRARASACTRIEEIYIEANWRSQVASRMIGNARAMRTEPYGMDTTVQAQDPVAPTPFEFRAAYKTTHRARQPTTSSRKTQTAPQRRAESAADAQTRRNQRICTHSRWNYNDTSWPSISGILLMPGLGLGLPKDEVLKPGPGLHRARGPQARPVYH